MGMKFDNGELYLECVFSNTIVQANVYTNTTPLKNYVHYLVTIWEALRKGPGAPGFNMTFEEWMADKSLSKAATTIDAPKPTGLDPVEKSLAGMLVKVGG